jgi:hypothetical protein
MNPGALPFVPPRFHPAAAPIEIQRPEWFTAATGAKKTFQSARDMLAYEAGVRSFHDRGEIGPMSSPHWQGWRDAEALADAELRGCGMSVLATRGEA